MLHVRAFQKLNLTLEASHAFTFMSFDSLIKLISVVGFVHRQTKLLYLMAVFVFQQFCDYGQSSCSLIMDFIEAIKAKMAKNQTGKKISKNLLVSCGFNCFSHSAVIKKISTNTMN